MQSGKKVVAIDGGGTKTSVCLMSVVDDARRYHVCGPSNYKLVGATRTKESLVGQVMAFLEDHEVAIEEVACMVYGIAGLDTESDRTVYQNIILATGIDEDRLVLCNDAEMAFMTVGKPPGVVLVAGTGSIAFALSGNDTFRCGGWGSPFSDLGSGIWIGNRLLQHVIPYCDGCGEYDPAYDACLEMVGAKDKGSFLEIVSEYGLDKIGSFAKVVLEQAEFGNALCKSIVEEATQELANLVKQVAQKAGFPEKHGLKEMTSGHDCILSGGLVNNEYFYSQLKNRIEGSDYAWNVMRYEGKPVDGGIAIALNRVGNDDEDNR